MAVCQFFLEIDSRDSTKECRHYYSAVLRTHQGFVAPTQGKLLNFVHRVPLGVVAQITVSFQTIPLRALIRTGRN